MTISLGAGRNPPQSQTSAFAHDKCQYLNGAARMGGGQSRGLHALMDGPFVSATGRHRMRIPPPAVMSRLPQLARSLRWLPRVRRETSRAIINWYATASAPRPRPFSLVSDYCSWRSLTDRRYSGRHLPVPKPEAAPRQPPLPDVAELFLRQGKQIDSTDTSAMFAFFAQWFTDSFLRTDHHDPKKNTSNHEIDLCQIYGLSEEKTRMLRAGIGGRLKSQLIKGEEFPAALFELRKPGERPVFKAEFRGASGRPEDSLHDEDFLIDVILGDAPDDRLDSVFAVGLEHGNSTIGNTIMNTVFLREHNRVAGILAAEHPDWDDDRCFETTRNILIVLLLKLVIEDYIVHIMPFDFPLEAVPSIADGARWNRTNWISVEFSLLYRWHSLVPDEIGKGRSRLGPGAFRNNNPLVIERGIETLMRQCSETRAGRIGLRNTPRFLVERMRADWPSVEERTILLSRTADLASYNDYRSAFGLRRLGSFAELTADSAMQQRLAELYGDIDHLEWYVGIFAEDYAEFSMMGELLTTMVAYDAFTQALTNPLLGRNVFNADTFTATGLRIIEETGCLEDIVRRNARAPRKVSVNFSVS